MCKIDLHKFYAESVNVLQLFVPQTIMDSSGRMVVQTFLHSGQHPKHTDEECC